MASKIDERLVGASGPSFSLANPGGHRSAGSGNPVRLTTGGRPVDTAHIRNHLEAVRRELRPPLRVLEPAEGHAEAAGDAALAEALANLTHRVVETLDACERAVEALDALEAIGHGRAPSTG
jgi:hypothetical protein